jgi:hypothetical protein
MTSRIVLVLLCCLAVGCATGRGQVLNQNGNDENGENGEEEEYIAESYCSPAVSSQPAGQRFTVQMPVPPSGQPSDEVLLFLSPATRQIAKIIGAQDLVAQIPVLEMEVSQNVEGARLRLLELRQELSDQLLLALFDAESVAAELECQKGRAESLAAGLDEVQNDIQQRRTVIALLADATAGLLSGIFLFGGSEVLAGGADVIGNILQGSYGYAALGGQQERELPQQGDLLKEVWEGPEHSTLFPESVWRFLNWRYDTQRTRSRRDAIVEDWKKRLGQPGSEKESHRKELFFGTGGVYTVPELRHRVEMLDRLKAAVRLMSQDLNLLFKESIGHLSGIMKTANERRLVPTHGLSPEPAHLAAERSTAGPFATDNPNREAQ